MAHHAAAEADGGVIHLGHGRTRLRLCSGLCGTTGSGRVGHYPSPQVILEARACSAWCGGGGGGAAADAPSCLQVLLLLFPLDVLQHSEEEVAPRRALEQVREAEEGEINQALRKRRGRSLLLLLLLLRRRCIWRRGRHKSRGRRRVHKGKKPRGKTHQGVNGAVHQAGRGGSREISLHRCGRWTLVADLERREFPELAPERIRAPAGSRCFARQLPLMSRLVVLPACLWRLVPGWDLGRRAIQQVGAEFRLRVLELLEEGSEQQFFSARRHDVW